MFTMQEIPFFLPLFCIILLQPQCMARNTMDSSPLVSAPISAPSEVPSSDSNPPSPYATTFSGSIAEILKRAIAPKYNLNLTPSPQPNPNPNSALKSICDSTYYPEVCVSRLSPILASCGDSGDPMSVLEASIKACIEPLHDAVANLSSSASKTTSPEAPSHASALADCEDNYKDALDNLQNALDASKSRDISTVNSLLSAVVSDTSTCDDAFKDIKESPVADFNGLISNLASNCLALASLIHF